MIEIIYTIPGFQQRVRPFYTNRRAANRFVADLKKKFPEATYEWCE
jgi:hypothetical protein